jgi:hypothetical protein
MAIRVLREDAPSSRLGDLQEFIGVAQIMCQRGAKIGRFVEEDHLVPEVEASFEVGRIAG